MNTQVLSPTDSAWQECLNDLPHDFYHLPGYLELEAQRHCGHPEAIIINDGEQVFFLPYILRNCHQTLDIGRLGGEPIYDVISPYGYPGMLVNLAGQNQTFIDRCLKAIHERWYEKNICSAFLRLHPIINSYIDPKTSNPDRFLICERGDVVICDLTNDYELIWKQMRANHRTKINKLRRAGFVVRMESVDKYLDVFIDIYIETMSRVNAHTAYFFTRDYFEKFCQALDDRLQICVVEIDGTVAAASLVTESSDIVQYHLGGTKTEFLPQSPTTMMFDYMIKWGQQRGNKYLNLGGGLGSSSDSLFHFKSGFSDRVGTFMTMQSIINQNLYHHLTQLRAEALQKTIAEFESTSFFPVYRSC
ncbi:GNAT family N-acetyltransferase [Chamaesiphon minutus]|uniref:FemAB family n=1 Tax=Chamaesiphon minutus (strain ATCC 27169 / PCC 6605) TaxID=1173020 RepID=K9UHX1_CHAP6|nr:GNAT family N-acetyltransferase [Chamaesiphon minutus]AFY93784.1 FemAB family [Chamaesiphon minutus PCC 6605]